jgi:hypothetical protein
MLSYVRFLICLAGIATAVGYTDDSRSACRGDGPTGVAANVVLITLDGLRGEEVFTGADKRLIAADNGVKEPEKCLDSFWTEDPVERRRRLLPFLWSRMESDGWIAGDIDRNSIVRVTNGMYFSYPGYNEILTGFPDPKVDSNDKKYNTNVTVLEWLHSKPEFQGRVAAYGSWDVFPYIINDRRSGIPVNAGWEPLVTGDAKRLEALNFVAANLFREWDGVRYDAFTVQGAVEEIHAKQPRVLFVSLGETDDWAHGGRYDRYLLTAQQNDRFIETLWNTTQSLDAYRDKTLFLVTTDHGRGDGREGWKNHSRLLQGSERIWIAAFGAGLVRHGIDEGGEFEQAQVASTVARALGHDFQEHDSKVRPPLPILKSAAP